MLFLYKNGYYDYDKHESIGVTISDFKSTMHEYSDETVDMSWNAKRSGLDRCYLWYTFTKSTIQVK